MQDEQCILIHGFTGSPEELEPLREVLAKAGYEVTCPVLHGHGGTREDLKRATASNWVMSVQPLVEAALKRGPVHLIGFSMGAMIAALMARKYPVASVTMLAPAVYYSSSKQMFSQMARLIKTSWNTSGSKTDFIRSQLEKAAQTPLQSVRQFRRLIQTAKPALAELTAPLCIIQGEQDEVIEPRSAAFVYNAVTSVQKEVHYLQESEHMLCYGPEAEVVNQLVLEFLTSVQLSRSV